MTYIQRKQKEQFEKLPEILKEIEPTINNKTEIETYESVSEFIEKLQKAWEESK